ncbi:hypothetical protein AB0J21_31680 [Streptomyces sp. NPDC049954]|uniref:hypothetical protein n=1 Tax=Streptomyces sp. NPDC049954 TaxID=3155779 RepID=UPI00343CA6B6
MAVSKSRKKSKKPAKTGASRSGNPALRAAAAQEAAAVPAQRHEPFVDGLFGGFSEQRRRLDAQRERRAGREAAVVIESLLQLTTSPRATEDALCLRMGELLSHERPLERSQRPDDVDPLQRYGPEHLLPVLTNALVGRAAASAEAPRQERESLHRLLVAAARISATPVPDGLVLAIGRLARSLDAAVGPHTPDALKCEPQGAALWCRDGYGTRFAITAPFTDPDGGPDRWYLWDVDACTTDAFTVGSGYFPDPATALTAWRDGAGQEATHADEFTPVTDRFLAARLLPSPPDFLHPGGEDEHQFAEFHRCRRLAAELRNSPHIGKATSTPPPAGLDAWAEEFAAWRAEHRGGRSAIPDGHPITEEDQPPSERELYEDLARSWHIDGFPELAYACSPHRLSYAAASIRDYYTDPYSSLIVGLLPDVAAWLTGRAALPAHLAERSHATAAALAGARGADLAPDEDSMLARVAE